MDKWLIYDCMNSIYRALYTTGGLNYNGHPTGALFGFFREVLSMIEEYQPTKIIFCFDHGVSLREQIVPTYKLARREKRKEQSEEEKETMKGFYDQVWMLKVKYLKEIGFRNVFFKKGYEADDLIAVVAAMIPDEDLGLIISGDRDLYQLLRSNVKIGRGGSSPNKFYTVEDFRNDFGLPPSQWPTVKALAGCSSDGIIGVQGVGEITAAKFLAGEMNRKTATYLKIVEQMATWKQNVKLTLLPYPGIGDLEIKKDEVTKGKWNKVLRSVGITSLSRLL